MPVTFIPRVARQYWVLALVLLGSAGAARAEFAEAVLFAAGTEGYHTFRIPALAVTSNGTLLAFCEGRKNSSADSGDIDIVLKRSLDGGATWGALAVVQEEGGSSAITIGNPAPVLDRETGRLWLASCRNNSQVFLSWSDDDGLTWAPRQDITAAVKLTNWTWVATGPVHGLQLERGPSAGRLIIPCDHRTSVGVFGAHVFYSDDHGANWTLGGSVDTQSGLLPNESVAVELTNGTVCLNSRNHGGQYRRVAAYSADGGASFGPAAAVPALIEPVCQASLLRYAAVDRGDAANLLLFSNPAALTRTRLTVRRSADEAASWDAGKLIYAGPAGYSDLARLPDGRVGLLYERGTSTYYQAIAFARFDLAHLDLPDPPEAWPGRAFWTLNEKAPGEAADTSAGAIRDVHPDGLGLHLTVTNVIRYTNGAPDYGGTPALAFTGTSRLFIPDAATSNRLDVGTEDSFTVEAAVRVPSNSAQVGNIVSKDVGAGVPSWWMRVDSGGVRFMVGDGPHEPGITSTNRINDGRWHHVAGVRDRAAGVLRVYVDYAADAVIEDTTVGPLANTNPVAIGRFNAGTRPLTGDVDFVRFSNRALTPPEFVPLDHDGDGLPTDWETASGLDPRDNGGADPQQGWSGDPDLDGCDNWAEYLADTSPTNGGFWLRLDLSVAADGMMHVGFWSSSSRVYTVERTLALPPNGWNEVGRGFPGIGNRVTVPDAVEAGMTQAAYRVRAALP